MNDRNPQEVDFLIDGDGIINSSQYLVFCGMRKIFDEKFIFGLILGVFVVGFLFAADLAFKGSDMLASAIVGWIDAPAFNLSNINMKFCMLKTIIFI